MNRLLLAFAAAAMPAAAQCTLGLTPASTTVPATAGTSVAVVTRTGVCAGTLGVDTTTLPAWLTAQVSGPEAVAYTWTANAVGLDRVATIRVRLIGSATFADLSVRQFAAPIQIVTMASTSARASCDPFVVPIHLSGWVSGTRIFVDGEPVSAYGLAANTLLATFPAHRMASPGTAKITAVRPNGDTSASVNFEILDRAVPFPLAGLNVGFFPTGDPNVDPRVSEATIEAIVARSARLAQSLKIFSARNGLEKAPAIIRKYGRKPVVVAWLGRDLAANELEIASLIALARQGLVDVALVGSEAAYRNDITVAQLIAYIRRVRAALPGIPVSTAEAYDIYRQNPALLAEVTEVHFNTYITYWENQPLEGAVAKLHRRVLELKALSGGKKVVVSETSHPTHGAIRAGAAVPSLENAAAYLKNVHSYAQISGTPVFFFESVDEPFKEKYEAAGIRWGALNASGVFKPGMCESFEGRFVADNWSQVTGTPAVQIVSAPPLGVLGPVKGTVTGVQPSEYKVALYLLVKGLGYWSKPTLVNPSAAISAASAWEAVVTTGGSDLTAGDLVVAVLVPVNYAPPLLRGAPQLPAELSQFPQAQIERR